MNEVVTREGCSTQPIEFPGSLIRFGVCYGRDVDHVYG